MKKLALLPFAFFLLFPLAQSSAAPQNPALSNLRAFVEATEVAREEPISEEEQTSILVELDDLVATAHASNEDIFNAKTAEINARTEMKIVKIKERGDKALASGEEKINSWYEKNKDRPGAAEKAAKMRQRLQKNVAQIVLQQSRAAIREGAALQRANQKRFDNISLLIDRMQVEASENIAARPLAE